MEPNKYTSWTSSVTGSWYGVVGCLYEWFNQWGKHMKQASRVDVYNQGSQPILASIAE